MKTIDCEKLNEIFHKEILEVLKKYDIEFYKLELINKITDEKE